MIASFEPDEEKATIWQLELLKSDSSAAQYIFSNREWMQSQGDGEDDESE